MAPTSCRGAKIDRAIMAGMKPEDIVFSGVGKTLKRELRHGLTVGVGQFNLESEGEGV